MRHFEVGSFLLAKTFPQFADVREMVQTVTSLPGAHGIALALNERGVNEALASCVPEIASVVSATEAHSQANANRSRDSTIANVRRLCDLRDASDHKPIVHAAISVALGCSISGPVDPNEVRCAEVKGIVCVWPAAGQAVLECRSAKPGRSWVKGVEGGHQREVDVDYDERGAPHHGRWSANPSVLYARAKPWAVMVSHRMPAAGTSDALTPLERSGIPLLLEMNGFVR